MFNAILVALGIRKKEMNKFWVVYAPGENKTCKGYGYPYCYALDEYYTSDYYTDKFDTLAEAEAKAAELSIKNIGKKYTILEAMSVSVPPIPDVKFTALTSATPTSA